MRPSTTSLTGATLGLLALLLGLPTARPCGALLQNPAANAAIDGQRALVVWRKNTVDIHVQLKLTGSAAKSVWLIPVSAIPELAVGSAALFDELASMTTPQVELQNPDLGAGSGGCGQADAAAGAANGSVGGVTFFESGTVGDYQYEVVLAQTALDVIDHLTAAGFTVPEAWETEITTYVDKGMLFVAAKLNNPVAADTEALEPLVLTLPRPATSELVYPAGLGRLSSSDVMPVLMYQLSDRRYRVVNYGSISLDSLATKVRENFNNNSSSDYADALDALTATAGGRLAVTEWARDLRVYELPPALAALVDDDSFYLTRTFLRPRRDDLVDMLLSFAFEAPDEDGFAEAPATSSSGLPVLALVFALFAGLLVLRRRHGLDLERP